MNNKYVESIHNKMKAIGYTLDKNTNKSSSLQDIEIPKPEPHGHDLLVEVKSVAVNPVDYKVYQQQIPKEGAWRILGWDASGVVSEVGEQVTLFKPGDEVWYSGDIERPGSYEEFQLVDERIVGHKPKTLDFAHAASLPLTSLVSWEMLFDRMHIPYGPTLPAKTVLVIGASGGVGSIMCQLLLDLTQTIIIGTASRAESIEWLKKLGIKLIINHKEPLKPQLLDLGYPLADYVICLENTHQHYDEITQIVAPEGFFGFTDEPGPLDLIPLKMKSVTLTLEVMYTRAMFKTADMIQQHVILETMAELVDRGILHATVSEEIKGINANNLTQVFKLLETHQAHGKIVLTEFDH